MGGYDGSLNNGGEAVTLVATDGEVLLDFEYDDNLLWPQNADGAGGALELSAPELVAWQH